MAYSRKNLVVLTLNARSVKNKTDQVAELILEKDIDVCGITETWLSGGERDSVIRGTLCPDGYKLLDGHQRSQSQRKWCSSYLQTISYHQAAKGC